MNLQEKFILAAEAIRNSKAIVITAGAGMGVDSALPDLRGDKGFCSTGIPMIKEDMLYNIINVDTETNLR